ncbi:MAG TPA: hypothetical protein VFL03_09590 [Candidatus Limnocylindrales bacterium]|nr:hypothetical protein [Candidatus Limnocylindrales bacterium]
MTDDRRHAPTADSAPAALVALADLLGGESSRSKRFLGGLVAGALVGAALAGTSFLRSRAPRDTADGERPSGSS